MSLGVQWRSCYSISSHSALDGGEWLASRPGCFTPGEKSCLYPLDRWLGGLQSRCERYKGKKSPPNGHQSPVLRSPPIALSV